MNTRNKRASAIGLGLAALVVLPAPDGSSDQPDRQQVALCYSGISAVQLIDYDEVMFAPGSVHLRRAGFTNITLESS